MNPTIREWWKASVRRRGWTGSGRQLAAGLWEFVRESTPSRRRQRYGDVEYDWEHRVDTTSATVGWRERLLGSLHSVYQPTDPALFQQFMASLAVDFPQYTFIDLGSGKGRTLLMASEYGFRRVIGVELLPGLHAVAVENIQKWKLGARIESICGDARDFVFPLQPIVLYLFNPLPEDGLREVVENLKRSLRENARPAYVIYHNPVLADVFTESGFFACIGAGEGWMIFSQTKPPGGG